MKNRFIVAAVVVVVILAGLYWVFGMPRVGNPEIPTSAQAIERGEYLVNAGGCGSCHQTEESEGMTGGIELESPFGGVFHAPNITPAEETGIAGWTGRDFLLAMKHGRSPSGGFYWPAFPYRSYVELTDQEVLDMAAYLMAQPAIENDVPEHDLPAWQFSWMMAGWNVLADFMEGDYPELPSDDPQVERGAYLARALGHCGECHTPRNSFGIMQKPEEFTGSELVSTAIDRESLSSWSRDDFVGFLQLGMTASFDFVGGEMLEVIEHTSELTEEDQEAYAAFFVAE